MKANTPPTVDLYIAEFSPEIQELLVQVREAIRSAVPDAEEMISYQMPAYRKNGMLVYFAGCKGHIGFYPTNSGISNFEKELASYKTSKGAIQFPLGQPMPLDLIRQIVLFRVAENEEKAKAKQKKR